MTGGKTVSTPSATVKEVFSVHGSPVTCPRFLLVDAFPLDAQVFLDDRLLGSAGQLIAHAGGLT